jgi:hypothetical protein
MILIKHPDTDVMLNLSLAEFFISEGADMLVHFPGTRMYSVVDLTQSRLQHYNATEPGPIWSHVFTRIE